MDRPDHGGDAVDVPRPGPSGRGTGRGEERRPAVAADPDAPGRPLAEEDPGTDADADAAGDDAPGAAGDGSPGGDWPEPNEPG